MLASTIRKLITYVCTRAFMSERQMLLVLFPGVNIDHSQWCDSCGGRIGGPRLFCLDCAIKGTESFDSVDLCSAPQCVGARVARNDLEVAHEPDHRLVKVRATVLTRHHGRVHTAACGAFERVEETRRKVAEFPSHPDVTRLDEQKTSSFEPTETLSKSDKPDDVLNPLVGAQGEAEVEGKTGQDERHDQVRGEGLLRCGKCRGRLSFPFWYCIYCEG